MKHGKKPKSIFGANKGSAILGFGLIIVLVACSGQGKSQVSSPSVTPGPIAELATLVTLPTSTFSPTIPDPPTATDLPATTTPADIPASAQTAQLATSTQEVSDWQSLPVIPTISDTVRKIYAQGQTLHNHPNVFSKVGDCETSSAFFLDDFDLGVDAYDLGSYQDLQAAIDFFQGSFGRKSLAAGIGYTASSVLSAPMADPKVCKVGEFPLACEYRVNQPSFALIMFGTNDYVNSRATFELYMRRIIEYSIQEGIVPVLATKADNLEGDYSINALIAKLAGEYDIPLWNFWAAVHSLPGGGLQADGVHLTYYPTHLNDPQAMAYAFPVRNLTALEVLNALWKGVTH